MYVFLDLVIFFFPLVVIACLVFSLNTSDPDKVILSKRASFLSWVGALLCLVVFGILTFGLHNAFESLSSEETQRLTGYKALHIITVFVVMYLQGFKYVFPRKN